MELAGVAVADWNHTEAESIATLPNGSAVDFLRVVRCDCDCPQERRITEHKQETIDRAV
jgi:hypothetical protein